MKTRGSWVKVVKFTGGTVLVSSLLLLITFLVTGKRTVRSGERLPSVTANAASKQAPANENSRWAGAYGKLPLSFEENQGQTAQEVRYVSHGGGYALFLTAQEAVLALRPNAPHDLSPLHRTAYIRAMRQARRANRTTAIRMRLEGANPDPQIAGMDRLPTKVNYFIGSNPKNWHTDVPSYTRVKYTGVYPGVDLVFYGNQRRLEYDFIVAPGANPKKIALKVDGARKLRINSRGDLVLSVAGGEVELRKPVVYQNTKEGRREISGGYAITKDHRVIFAVASYDRSQPLILDPVLNYSTYLGGTATEDEAFSGGIAVDGSGDAFVAGQTTSIDFPAGTHGGVVATPASPNSGAAFVAELDAAGTTLLYSTYLAGTTTSAGDAAFGIAVDPSGKIYVTGVTFAAGFPTKSPLSSVANTTSGTCFVTKLDPGASGNSSLLFSSYLGGTGGDFCNAIAADATGNAYVAGLTDSTDFPTQNPFQGAPDPLNTFGTAFLSRIDTTAATLVYSTYLGGNGANEVTLTYGDQATGVAVDSSHIAYAVGTTTSTNFPIAGKAFQPNHPAGNILGAVFVSKIDTTITTGIPSLIYSTYLAGSLPVGSAEDQAFAVALGPNNVVYLTGTTNSTDFPTAGVAVQAPSASKAFVSLVDTNQTTSAATLKYSTYLGGSGTETGFGIKADTAGNAYVTGTTSSTDFPTTPGAFQLTRPNTLGDAFVAKINPNAAGTVADPLLVYSTYLGGSGDGSRADQALGIALDSATPPNAYITGETASMDFPVQSPLLPNGGKLQGVSDAFVAKLSLVPTLVVSPTSLAFNTILIPNTSPAQTVTLMNNTNAAITFTSATLTGVNAADFAISANTCGANIAAGTSCTVSATFKPSAPPAAEVATLVLTDGDSTSPQNIALSGAGTNTPPDFTLTGPAAAPSTKDGTTLNFPVTVTPVGGFSSAVTFTCTSAPALVLGTCNASTVTPADGVTPVNSTVTVTSTAFVFPPSRPRIPPPSIRQVVPLVLALMLLFLLSTARRLRTRFALGTAMLLFLVLGGCSGPQKPHTLTGNYTLTITGTSGALTHPVAVQITIN